MNQRKPENWPPNELPYIGNLILYYYYYYVRIFFRHTERESTGTLARRYYIILGNFFSNLFVWLFLQIALSSKLYILTDESDQQLKASAKGIQKQRNPKLMSKALFENLLHDREIGGLPVVVNRGFMQKNEKMKTYTLHKHSLHACYVKRVVRDCNIHTYTYPDY